MVTDGVLLEVNAVLCSDFWLNIFLDNFKIVIIEINTQLQAALFADSNGRLQMVPGPSFFFQGVSHF